MRTTEDLRERSASLYRWLAEQFGGSQHLPEKMIVHFEVHVPDMLAEIESLRAQLADRDGGSAIAAEAACAEQDHPMAVYDQVRNASLCVCGQAYESGNWRAKAASVTA